MFEEAVRKRNKRPRCGMCAELIQGGHAFRLPYAKRGKILVCESRVNKWLEEFLVVIDDETL